MNRRIFITAIPFLPALFLKPKPDTNSMASNQVHVARIKREAAKLKALIELGKIQREVDRLHAQFKLDRALYEKR